MADVLAITVPIEGRYASNNALGKDSHRGGRKSEAYKALFKSVKEAAEDEAMRIGWVPLPCEHDITILRYLPARWRTDAMNLGKCEGDALTAAGIWPDDRYANPARFLVRYDASGQHRIAIVVVKLYEPANTFALDAKPKSSLITVNEVEIKAESSVIRRPLRAPMVMDISKYRSGDPIPDGYADLNGELVLKSKALDMIRGVK